MTELLAVPKQFSVKRQILGHKKRNPKTTDQPDNIKLKEAIHRIGHFDKASIEKLFYGFDLSSHPVVINLIAQYVVLFIKLNEKVISKDITTPIIHATKSYQHNKDLAKPVAEYAMQSLSDIDLLCKNEIDKKAATMSMSLLQYMAGVHNPTLSLYDIIKMGSEKVEIESKTFFGLTKHSKTIDKNSFLNDLHNNLKTYFKLL
jgi:hypothetical protein